MESKKIKGVHLRTGTKRPSVRRFWKVNPATRVEPDKKKYSRQKEKIKVRKELQH